MGYADLGGGNVESVESWPDGEFVVRPVQPYEATKDYRCPGCDHEIRTGVSHLVVVPHDEPEDRRHWHTECWRRELRRLRGR
jgi:hypothetical protein